MVRTWDVATGKQVREFEKPLMTPLAIGPGGKLVALAKDERTVLKIFAVDTKKVFSEMDLGDKYPCIRAGAFSPDGKIFGNAGRLRRSQDSGRRKRDLDSPDAKKRKHQWRRTLPFRGLFSRRQAYGCWRARQSDAGVGRPDGQGTPEGEHRQSDPFSLAAFSPDSLLMFYAAGDDSVVFDLRNGKELCHLPEQGGGVFSPDGSLLAVPGQTEANEPVITFYNMPKGRSKPFRPEQGVKSPGKRANPSIVRSHPRGGCWSDPGVDAGSACRQEANANMYCGFRVAVSVGSTTR